MKLDVVEWRGSLLELLRRVWSTEFPRCDCNCSSVLLFYPFGCGNCFSARSIVMSNAAKRAGGRRNVEGSERLDVARPAPPPGASSGGQHSVASGRRTAAVVAGKGGTPRGPFPCQAGLSWNFNVFTWRAKIFSRRSNAARIVPANSTVILTSNLNHHGFWESLRVVLW